MGASENTVLAQVPVNPAEAQKRAEQDMNFLAYLALFEIMQFPFPALYVAMWELMKSKVHLVRDFSKLALGIPRGFAKTTFIKLWIVYCILFTRKSFIIVISYNEDHAISVIADVCKMLSSPNIVTLFGDWTVNRDVNQNILKVFRFRGREIILKAVGAKGGIRGLNYGHKRPDVIVFEDYQKKQESENEEVSTALYKDMIGTAMKTKSPFGCLFIFVANMYPTPGSILKKLKTNSDWISLILGGIVVDEKGDSQSLWEDLHPLTQLLDEYESDLKAGCPEVFLAEVLNDETAGIKVGIDITKLPKFPYDAGELPQGRAVVIDPALDNPSSDYNGIGLVGLFDGKGVLEEADLARYNPLQLIKNAIILAYRTSTRLICVESVAYQASLLFWFNKICQDNGIEGFYFMALKVGGRSKNAKIIAALRKWQAGEQYVKDKVRPLIINEIIKFDPLKKNNQDTCLDLLTFVDMVIEQHRELMYMPYEEEMMAVANAAPRLEEENCTF
jgi:hypothetical protein